MRRRYHARAPSGTRRKFDEEKVRRKAGRFADKPGAGKDAPGPVKRSGLTREDVIEGLTERGGRLNGRTIGEVLDASDDEMAALRALAQRHRAGEIRFRQGKTTGPEDRVEIGTYLGKRYEVDADDIKLRGDLDDEAFEAVIEARIAKAPSDAIVLTAPINVRRGSVSPEEMRAELENSFDSHRNRPGFLGGEVGEIERQAVAEAAQDYVKRHAKFFGRDQAGGMLILQVRRPSDSPYWKARAAAEKRFRRDGLTEGQIQDELSGVADQRREAARRASDATLSDQRRAATDTRLREAYGAEVDRFASLRGRDLFIARNALIQRFARERGETLAYA